MRCNRLNVKLLQNICSAIMQHKDFCVKILTKLNDSKPIYKANNAEYIKQKYGVYYCVRYKPVGMLERILARGWWNDAGVRPPDGKFKD